MAGTSFRKQANALFRKNAVYQRRRICINACTILLPLLFVGLLKGLQTVIDGALDTPSNRCGCMCTLCCPKSGAQCRPATASTQCNKTSEECKAHDESVCGTQFSTVAQSFFCEIPHPSSWPPVMTIPDMHKRAAPWRPGAVMFFAGSENGTVASSIVQHMLPPFAPSFPTGKFSSMGKRQGAFRGEVLSVSGFAIGSSKPPYYSHFVEPAFTEPYLYSLSQDCSLFPSSDRDGTTPGAPMPRMVLPFGPGRSVDLECVKTPFEKRTVDGINRQLFCGYEKAYCNHSEGVQTGDASPFEVDFVEEYSYAWDFKDSDGNAFSVDVWHNGFASMNHLPTPGPGTEVRVNGAQNAAMGAWVKWNLGVDHSAQLLAVEEMPKPSTSASLQISSLIAEILFCWVVQMPLPIMLVQLVYEKEQKLRIMMKMHGLGDAAYWAVNYAYYLLFYLLYIAVFIGVGSAANLSICRLTDYGLQFFFYFLFGNVQICFAFLASCVFSSSHAAMDFGLLWVFATGMVGDTLIKAQITKGLWYVSIAETIPAFGAYRGLYEMSQYSFRGAARNSMGLTWKGLKDHGSGMGLVLIIFALECPIFLLLAWYLEQVVSEGVGGKRHPLFFLGNLLKMGGTSKPKEPRKGSTLEAPLLGSSSAVVEICGASNGADEENRRVENAQLSGDAEELIVIQELSKTFPVIGSGEAKVAVDGVDLSVRRGEVFGLLGPNGAGKTTIINVLVGVLPATKGTAVVAGFKLGSEMGEIYNLMGVCPQNNTLWEDLTGREHLLFYGRLKGLTCEKLQHATEDALKSVRLFNYGQGDKLVGQYSGGMKRRLTVAISLMGGPEIVYLDEPSTGLDPASRRSLWKLVKNSKTERAIILTTHSMEEAEVLCDRLGVIVDGRLVTIGNPKELTATYGGYLVLALTVSQRDVEAVKELVLNLDPGAQLTYELSGTLRFELSKEGTKPSAVFQFMEELKTRIQIVDWGLTNATLEDVFIKIAESSGARTDQLS